MPLEKYSGKQEEGDITLLPETKGHFLESFRKGFWRCSYEDIVGGRKGKSVIWPEHNECQNFFLPALKDKNQVNPIKKQRFPNLFSLISGLSYRPQDGLRSVPPFPCLLVTHTSRPKNRKWHNPLCPIRIYSESVKDIYILEFLSLLLTCGRALRGPNNR